MLFDEADDLKTARCILNQQQAASLNNVKVAVPADLKIQVSGENKSKNKLHILVQHIQIDYNMNC